MSLSKDKIISIYEEMLFETGEQVCVPNNDDQLLYIKRYLPGNWDARILDAGCGNGKYMRKIKELGYNNVYGIDLFQNIKGFRNHYVCASIDAIPFPNESFDMIYSNSVIYCLDRPIEAVKEFFRVLKQGGYLLITAHTKYSLFTLDRILKRSFKSNSVKHLEGVSFYSSIEYKKMMEEVGFKVIEIDGFKLSYFLWPFIKKTLGKICKLIKVTNSFSSCLGKKVLSGTSNKKRNKTWGLLRSIFCYHAVLIGCK